MMEVREAVKRIVDKLEGATQKREFWGHFWGQNRVWGVFWGWKNSRYLPLFPRQNFFK